MHVAVKQILRFAQDNLEIEIALQALIVCSTY